MRTNSWKITTILLAILLVAINTYRRIKKVMETVKVKCPDPAMPPAKFYIWRQKDTTWPEDDKNASSTYFFNTKEAALKCLKKAPGSNVFEVVVTTHYACESVVTEKDCCK